MSKLSFCLCLLVLFHGCLATHHGQQQQQHQFRGQNVCQLQNLEALEPTNRVKAEAGLTEVWDHNDDQLRCAGVTVVRHTIQPKGLLLPSFTNSPQLIYIVQGRGIQGTLIPGCPETFQSGSQQSYQGHGQREQEQKRGREEEQEQRQGSRQDQHQKIRHFKEGDVIALPAGVANWAYNEGNSPVVAVILLDNTNNANQLDQNPRRFYLAGNPQQEHQQQERQQRQKHRGQESSGNNIFSGFDVRVLAEAFGVSTETAKKLQSQNDNRGNIVRVESGLQVIRPQQGREERERGQREEGPWGRDANGLEETLCSAQFWENIDNPSRADVFTPHAGRISTLNSNNLPILSWLRLSAERGVLYKNAIHAPYYNLNAHGITYVTKGRARVQIVNDNGQTVFDDDVREGQILVEPQNFGVLKQAGNEGFEYITFKTNDNAIIHTMAGRVSAMRAMPVDVLANAYQISKQDASQLKFNREETTLFRSQRSSYERRDVA